MMVRSGQFPGEAASGPKPDRSPTAVETSPSTAQYSDPASALTNDLTIQQAAEAMTLDDAIRVARSIQRDLDAGRLKVPYPPQVRRSLLVCHVAISARCKTDDEARVVVERLEAKEDVTDTVVPAWG